MELIRNVQQAQHLNNHVQLVIIVTKEQRLFVLPELILTLEMELAQLVQSDHHVLQESSQLVLPEPTP